MPFDIDGRTVYRIGEALREAGVSRATYFRWVREGQIADTEFRDRNGRRVLTAEELEHLKRFAHRLVESPQMRFSAMKAQ
jgi:predicted site-specific integrase-resolvase